VSEFKSTQQIKGSELVLAFEGLIDEDVTFPSVEAGKFATVTIDLASVKAINSVGIREWLNWIKPIAAQSQIQLSRCPKALVFQFNMVEGFLPANSTVISFYVPFFCEKCDKEQNALFTIGKEVSVSGGNLQISFDKAVLGLCTGPDCELEMDVTEAKYFQFLKRMAG
jgi:hypothetical protein